MAGLVEPIMGESKKRVVSHRCHLVQAMPLRVSDLQCYFFDSDIGNYHYGPGHPMKPTRIRMCHSLVMNYGLYKQMEIFRAKPATKREMSQFHTDEYVDFLHRITPDNEAQFAKEQVKYNVGDDCPIFDGLFEYCSISAGGSMEGAARLSRDKCDIAVNWAGGLHHAKKAEASGFCYVNGEYGDSRRWRELGVHHARRSRRKDAMGIRRDRRRGHGLLGSPRWRNRLVRCASPSPPVRQTQMAVLSSSLAWCAAG